MLIAASLVRFLVRFSTARGAGLLVALFSVLADEWAYNVHLLAALQRGSVVGASALGLPMYARCAPGGPVRTTPDIGEREAPVQGKRKGKAVSALP